MSINKETNSILISNVFSLMSLQLLRSRLQCGTELVYGHDTYFQVQRWSSDDMTVLNMFKLLLELTHYFVCIKALTLIFTNNYFCGKFHDVERNDSGNVFVNVSGTQSRRTKKSMSTVCMLQTFVQISLSFVDVWRCIFEGVWWLYSFLLDANSLSRKRSRYQRRFFEYLETIVIYICIYSDLSCKKHWYEIP